ncbi:hypothetical protein BDQ17DRAFT_1413592 [Cyathus striatus]|nr:hypothetical protein BDQ17DRAFT_1413592 [Cyathus striatus]
MAWIVAVQVIGLEVSSIPPSSFSPSLSGTGPTITNTQFIRQLKQVKNTIINPAKKAEVARDGAFVRTLRVPTYAPLFPSAPLTNHEDVRKGIDDPVISLLRARTYNTLLYALAHIQPTDSQAFAVALARALRAMSAAAADVLGPSPIGFEGPLRKREGEKDE